MRSRCKQAQAAMPKCRRVLPSQEGEWWRRRRRCSSLPQPLHPALWANTAELAQPRGGFAQRQPTHRTQSKAAAKRTPSSSLLARAARVHRQLPQPQQSETNYCMPGQLPRCWVRCRPHASATAALCNRFQQLYQTEEGKHSATRAPMAGATCRCQSSSFHLQRQPLPTRLPSFLLPAWPALSDGNGNQLFAEGSWRCGKVWQTCNKCMGMKGCMLSQER